MESSLFHRLYADEERNRPLAPVLEAVRRIHLRTEARFRNHPNVRPGRAMVLEARWDLRARARNARTTA